MPSIVAVIHSAVGVRQVVRTQCFVKGSGWIVSFPDQPHRRNALTEKSACDVTDQATPYTHALVVAAQIDLVQLSPIIRVVGPTRFRKSYHLAIRAFDDKAEPVPVRLGERLSPLPFT